MKKPKDCSTLLLDGFNPREISIKLGINYDSVVNNLYTAIGAGLIKRSDILLSIDDIKRKDYEEIIDFTIESHNSEKKRRATEEYKENPNSPFSKIRCSNAETSQLTKDRILTLDWDDSKILYWGKLDSSWFCSLVKKYLSDSKDIDFDLFKLYFELRTTDVWLGELYWKYFFIENQLHDLVIEKLKSEYGFKENQWWRQIPLKIRKELQAKREEDDEPVDAIKYTFLIDIKEIINKHWKLFSPIFEKRFVDKKSFLSNFNKLNNIRNTLMHPIKKQPKLEELYYIDNFLNDLRFCLYKYKKNQ